MTRKAILIESSNVKGQKDLPGACLDVKNWKSFLKSDLGGRWMDSEICSMSKPYSGDLERELNVVSDCYCFVAFSGHGDDGSVVLNDYFDSYSIASLRPKTNRGTLIVDACRGVPQASSFSFRANIAALTNRYSGITVARNSMSGEATDFVLSESVRYKAATTKLSPESIWYADLLKKGSGVVDMLACAKGQDSNEDPNAGGFYTMLLLESAEQWRVTSSLGGVHSTKDAHDFARARLPEQQTPEYSPSWLAFPFAVQSE